jgi:hypothetical protein
MPDKRRWTTSAQRAFLVSYSPQYIEAQASRRYDKFWPTFFQDWFAAFPEPEPADDNLTDSESEAASESELSGSDAETVESGSKRKRPGRKSKAKKRIQKVRNTFYVRPHCN